MPSTYEVSKIPVESRNGDFLLRPESRSLPEIIINN
jgi:hypothetical protein